MWKQPRTKSAVFRRRTPQRGLALVTVLWVLMLLSLIAASFTRTVRTEINLTRNLIESAKAVALADAGVYRAVLGLFAPVNQGGWRVDDTVYAWAYGGGEIRVSVQDEGGKIDLNKGQDALLRILFNSLGLEDQESAALVDAIVDFRDPDDLRRLNGAEDGDYALAGLAHDAKDAPFEAVEELHQVLGMTPALYDRVAPSLTVYSGLRSPHLATAPPAVLDFLSAVSAAAFGQEFPTDTTVKESEPPAPPPSTSPLTAEPEIIRAGRTTARSRVKIYTIHAEGHVASGAVFAREAVVQVTGGNTPYRFFAWRQGPRQLFGFEKEVN